MTAKPELRRFQTQDALFADLADNISERLIQAVDARGAASLIVPGGSTPGKLFDILATRSAPWDRVTVAGTDERWLPEGHPDRHEALVRRRLLTGEAAAGRYLALKTDDASPDRAGSTLEARFATLPRPFDVTIIGMGDDGHFASLFPHAPGLAQALTLDNSALTAAFHIPAAAGSPDRISLTLSALLESHFLAILITGADKLAVYERALAGDDALAMPVRALLHQESTPIYVYWSA
jgi:6-phosphogluconolactonase